METDFKLAEICIKQKNDWKNNFLESLKARRYALATLYLTETLENIGLANYNDVTQSNANTFIPKQAEDDKYKIELSIEESTDLFPDDNTKENILKKAIATISYKIGNKDYQYTMQRIKAKE